MKQSEFVPDGQCHVITLERLYLHSSQAAAPRKAAPSSVQCRLACPLHVRDSELFITIRYNMGLKTSRGNEALFDYTVRMTVDIFFCHQKLCVSML